MAKYTASKTLFSGELHHKNIQLADLKGEFWVDCYEFEGSYEVSNHGRVKSIERYVPHKNGQILIRERIRRQSIMKDGRLACSLGKEGKSYRTNLSKLVYTSFYPDKKWDIKKYCVMHKNKCKQDNRISNLKLSSISESHVVNNEKGLLPHLNIMHEKAREIYAKTTHKTCTKCCIKKDIEFFERGRNICIECRSNQKKDRYDRILKKSGKDRSLNMLVIITDTVTNEQTISKTKAKNMVSAKTINRYANTGIPFKPQKNSQNKNPILIELKKVERSDPLYKYFL